MATQASDIKVVVEAPRPTARRLTITVPAERVERTRQETTRRLAQQVRVRGFRRGKVPAQILERQYGADVKINRVVGELISPATFAAGVGVGTKLETTYNGFGCELTLTKVIPNDLVGVVFGTAFEGELRYL